MLLNKLVRNFRGLESPSAKPASPCFEPLESRIVLAGSPFPDVSELIDQSNTVVRLETSMGDIDIELFDQGGPSGSTAPVTTANFLNYVRDGDWDESFVHRLVNGFILQMGGFKFDDAGGISIVPADDPIVNEFSLFRSNIERTVAMAKLDGDPNSATSQLFINLADNSANLDNQNGGFTVFGRIATDASWTVVTAINALNVANFSSTHFALSSTPVNTSFGGSDPISESVLVTLIDIEIIKPASISAADDRFYTNVLAYPEGYRAETITESVALVNLGLTDSAYQIVVRYERGVRDQVIETGVLGADEHRTITISDFNQPSGALVREGVPYAIEIHSTGFFAASLTHTDFGAMTHESFYSIMQGEQDTLPETEQKNWALGGTVAVSSTSPIGPFNTRLPFLTYLNDSADFAIVTVTFIPQSGGSAVTVTKGLEPHRRGGLEIFNIEGVPRALAGIVINSTQPIVPALSVYENHRPAGRGDTPENFAYGTQMISGTGQIVGVLAGIPAGGGSLLLDSFLTIYNHSSSSVAVVTFTVITSAGSRSGFTTVQPNARAEFDISSLMLPWESYVTVRYTSGVTPVSVQYVSELQGDLVSTSFSNRAAGFWAFTGGSFDPAGGGSEVISVFNPHQGASVTKQLTVRYHFSDGTVTTLPLGALQLDSGERLDLDISDLNDTRFNLVRMKIQSAPEFSTYSITILSTIVTSPGGGFPTSVAAQLTRFSGPFFPGIGMSSTTGGVPLAGANYVPLSDPSLSGSIGL